MTDVIIDASVIAALGGIVFTLFSIIVSVPEGYSAIRTRFGKAVGDMKPGLNVLLPFIDSYTGVNWSWEQEEVNGKVYTRNYSNKFIPMGTIDIDLPEMKITSKDKAVTSVNVMLEVKVNDPVKVVYATEDRNAPSWVIKEVKQAIATYVRSQDSKKLYDNPALMEENLFDMIETSCDHYGFDLVGIKVQEILPDKEAQKMDKDNALKKRTYDNDMDVEKREQERKRKRLEHQLEMQKRESEAKNDVERNKNQLRLEREKEEETMRLQIQTQKMETDGLLQKQKLVIELERAKAECEVRKMKAEADAVERTAYVKAMSGDVDVEVIKILEETRRAEAMANGNVRYLPYGPGSFQHMDISKMAAIAVGGGE